MRISILRHRQKSTRLIRRLSGRGYPPPAYAPQPGTIGPYFVTLRPGKPYFEETRMDWIVILLYRNFFFIRFINIAPYD